MEEIINKKGIKLGDMVKIVLPEGTKKGDTVSGYTIIDEMFNANNSIVKVRSVDKRNVCVEIKGAEFWFDNSCVQPLPKYYTSQFKVGDVVVITIPIKYNTSTHIPFGITKGMLELNGVCTKITQIVEGEYDKSNFPKISNLDGCKYILETSGWVWPNCLLTKVPSCDSDFDLDNKISSLYQKIEQDSIMSLVNGPNEFLTSCGTYLCDTCTTKEGIKEDIKEGKDLIKVKTKKIKFNFKN